MLSIRTIYYVLLIFMTLRILFFFVEVYRMFTQGFPPFPLLVFQLATLILWVLALVMLASEMREGYYLAGFLGLISIPEFLLGVTDYPLGIEVFVIVWLIKAMEKFQESKT